jgi:hypothetical protein
MQHRPVFIPGPTVINNMIPMRYTPNVPGAATTAINGNQNNNNNSNFSNNNNIGVIPGTSITGAVQPTVVTNAGVAAVNANSTDAIAKEEAPIIITSDGASKSSKTGAFKTAASCDSNQPKPASTAADNGFDEAAFEADVVSGSIQPVAQVKSSKNRDGILYARIVPVQGDKARKIQSGVCMVPVAIVDASGAVTPFSATPGSSCQSAA